VVQAGNIGVQSVQQFFSGLIIAGSPLEPAVAELTAAFVCSHLGLSTEPRPDHAQYIGSWLKVLKADKRAIFTAASKAQQAADFMIQQSDRTAKVAA